MIGDWMSPLERPDPPPSSLWWQLTTAEHAEVEILVRKVNMLALGAFPNRKLPKTDFIRERLDAYTVTVRDAV